MSVLRGTSSSALTHDALSPGSASGDAPRSTSRRDANNPNREGRLSLVGVASAFASRRDCPNCLAPYDESGFCAICGRVDR